MDKLKQVNFDVVFAQRVLIMDKHRKKINSLQWILIMSIKNILKACYLCIRLIGSFEFLVALEYIYHCVINQMLNSR